MNIQKEQYSMHSYLIHNIPAEQNLNFLFYKQKYINSIPFEFHLTSLNKINYGNEYNFAISKFLGFYIYIYMSWLGTCSGPWGQTSKRFAEQTKVPKSTIQDQRAEGWIMIIPSYDHHPQ